MGNNNKRGSALLDAASSALFLPGRIASNPSVAREIAIRQMLEMKLTDLALTRFKWEGLPDTVDERFLESMLFLKGLSIYYYDKEYDAELAVQGSGVGYVNMVDNPTSFYVIGPGGKKPVTDTDASLYATHTLSAYSPMVHKKQGLSTEELKLKCIPIWNNYTRTPDSMIVDIYAQRLATIDRTLEINTKNARRNKVIKGSPNSQLSMVNFNRQVDEGTELLQVTGPMEDMQFIEALDLGITPDAYEKLGVHRTRVWNECMIMLGIDSANQEKKERMVAAEVSANDSQADAIRLSLLKERRRAADQINEVFGHNIKVDFEIELEKKEAMKEAAELEQPNDPNRNDGRSEDDEK